MSRERNHSSQVIQNIPTAVVAAAAAVDAAAVAAAVVAACAAEVAAGDPIVKSYYKHITQLRH